MNSEILDETFEEEEKLHISIEATSAVVVAFSAYVLIAFIILSFFNNGFNKPSISVFNYNFFSIFHFIIAMVYFIHRFGQDEKYNIKGGYYIIVIGAILYFILLIVPDFYYFVCKQK